MCGIAGIVDFAGRLGPARLEQAVASMGRSLAHRGPDGAGVWLDPTGLCALAHRRLAILDLSAAGRQPMVSADGKVALSFNGEIYNYRSLRERLIARGVALRSESDSEVLLHGFADASPDRLPEIDGMYAFAIWNAARRRLLLARDGFGKKPLYLASGPGWIAFASELRAFAAIPGFSPEIAPEAIAEYLALQYVHAPRSIYTQCTKLAPGSWATFEGAPIPRRRDGVHFRFEPTRAAKRMDLGSAAEAADALAPLLTRAVEKRLQSDVPLGMFLSGGIDSALVAAVARRELGRPLASFSLGFEGTPESEHELARTTARALDADHHEVVLSADGLDWLGEIAAALDEPLGDSGCLPMFLLCRFARSSVTVALSGDGGDETFGGYTRYAETLDEAASLARRLRFALRERECWTPAAYLGHRWSIFTPREVGSLAGGAARAHVEALYEPLRRQLASPNAPLIDRLRELDASTYLPGAVLAKVDRMSMAFGLEVRCPFLDREVAGFAASLPAPLAFAGSLSKPVLRSLAGRYLPASVVAQPKRGFGLPGSSWGRDALLRACRELLLAPDACVRQHLDPRGLAAFVARAEHGFSVFQVWTLLLLESWLRGARQPRSKL